MVRGSGQKADWSDLFPEEEPEEGPKKKETEKRAKKTKKKPKKETKKKEPEKAKKPSYFASGPKGKEPESDSESSEDEPSGSDSEGTDEEERKVRTGQRKPMSKPKVRRDGLSNAMKLRDIRSKKDLETEEEQDRLSKLSRSQMASVYLYVQSDPEDPKYLEKNSEVASNLARQLGEEVYTIVVDDIRDKSERPPWLRTTPTILDKERSKVFAGSAAIDFLKIMVQNDPSDKGSDRSGKRSGTWSSGVGRTKPEAGHNKLRGSSTHEEFQDFLAARAAQDRRLADRPRSKYDNVPGISHDEELPEHVQLRTGVHPVSRSVMDQRYRDHQKMLASYHRSRGGQY